MKIGVLLALPTNLLAYKLTDGMLSGLSPYITQHINRFGKYELDLDRKPTEIDYTVLAI